ncbi:hypothetical protein [Kordia sp.]|uniref:hypothetical protein n=1 Tax=Kordia sp. TaxID=1965332 RepID=UPI003D6B7FFD
MQDNIDAIIKALKIVKTETPQSRAVPLLEDALQQSMKLYVLNMASMGSVVDIEEIKQNFKNGLELLDIFENKK